ncbi:hypothetical protein HQ586_10660 [Candidatus Bathyarchaeota archaeon]|nr:hypothetical protein [Candidatus Bathyarchaeota archaeon]
MKVTGGKFSQRVLLLAFVLGVFVIAQSVKILNEMDYSEAGIPLWKGPWEDVPERYRVYLKLDGKLSSIEYPDWGYGSEAFSEYSDAMVIESTDSGDIRVPKEVYFWDDEGKTGLIPATTSLGLAYSQGDNNLRDKTFLKFVQALYEGWVVEVEGYAFDVMQGGKRLTLFDVEKLISTEKTEALRMYKHVGVSTNFGGIAGESSIPLPLPTGFAVWRIHEDDTWQEKEYDYGLWMEEGETIRYIFDSDKPLRFQITYSNHVSFTDSRPNHILVEEPSIMAANAYLTAEWEGFYIFRFEGGDPASYVEFNALRKIGENVSMPAWIMGGKGGGGSVIRIPVNESDLSQFPHLLEAFEARGRRTYCPASEAVRILKFFGDEYNKGIDWYGFKLVLEDGTMYHFGLTFGWIPLPVL